MQAVGNKNIVMVFDDDPDTLTLCSIILSAKGYVVHTSSTSNDIIAKVENLQPNLIIMDNWIPDKGGVEATRLLKEHDKFRSIPVIFFSANNEIQALAECAGADDYIAKPFDISYLEKKVKENLEASRESF